MKREYSFDPEEGIALCQIISSNGQKYIGFATCHDDDREFISERTGLQIAETRAELEALADIRDNEIIPALKALTHLYNNIQTSKYYNPKSYEATMLRRQVRIKENELIAIRQEIATLKQFLRKYIQQKEELHNKLRKGKID